VIGRGELGGKGSPAGFSDYLTSDACTSSPSEPEDALRVHHGRNGGRGRGYGVGRGVGGG